MRILGTVVRAALLIVGGCGDDDDAGDDGGAAVSIEVLEDPGGGPFTATGDAVDEGLLCASGSARIVGAVDEETGSDPTESTMMVLVEEEFTCEDGSGTFTLEQTQDVSDPSIFDEAVETGEPFPTEEWVISAGTGDYEGLEGSGTYTGQATEPGSLTIRNTFTGTLSRG